jgi:methylated-DNA-[protein]-cysteine S-methyltransferase
MNQLILRLEHVDTPLGIMLIATDENDDLRVLDWQDETDRMHQLARLQYKGLTLNWQKTAQASSATQAMWRYFNGELSAIEHIKTATGGTNFQRQIWAALRSIPSGQTISYKTLAERIGNPKAVRAVGLANGANPISIVVPCHRVIGSNKSLTGYGGGLPRKKWLLAHENALPPETAALPL